MGFSHPMSEARISENTAKTCEIIDFDGALLKACPAARRADVMMEAELLAGVFAPNRASADLEEMATQLSKGQRDSEMSRAHARLLAAALRHLAHAA